MTDLSEEERLRARRMRRAIVDASSLRALAALVEATGEPLMRSGDHYDSYQTGARVTAERLSSEIAERLRDG